MIWHMLHWLNNFTRYVLLSSQFWVLVYYWSSELGPIRSGQSWQLKLICKFAYALTLLVQSVIFLWNQQSSASTIKPDHSINSPLIPSTTNSCTIRVDVLAHKLFFFFPMESFYLRKGFKMSFFFFLELYFGESNDN